MEFYKKKLVKKHTNSKRKEQKKKSMFDGDGMLVSIETPYKKASGWNPHINVVLCTDRTILLERIKDGNGKTVSTNEDVSLERGRICYVGGEYVIAYIEKINTPKHLMNVVGYMNKFPEGIDKNLADYVSAMENGRHVLWNACGIFKDFFRRKKGKNKDVKSLGAMRFWHNKGKKFLTTPPSPKK